MSLSQHWRALRQSLNASQPRQRWRARGLWWGALLLGLTLLHPQASLPNRVYDWFFVVDITQSMNVQDYQQGGKSVSRLQVAKQALRQTIARLPCGSRVALGLFTERNSLNIVRPVEVCSHYAALDQTIARLDWRMAWAADSFIAHGVYSALEQTPGLGKDMRLMVLTDGHQAPPANPKYMPAFAGKVGEVKGYLIGMGQPTPSPIPKLDEKDAVAGYWEQEEVQRFGNFGMAETLSVLAMEQGQHDRNAGHGAGAELLSNAHLSGLDAANLQRLSSQTGLDYAALTQPSELPGLATGLGLSTYRWADTDLRSWLAVPAMLLFCIYLILTFADSGLWVTASRLIRQVRGSVKPFLPSRFRLKE